MARVTAPLFGLDASGTIAEALTYARWKGISYVRTRVVPTNPNTTKQQEVRGIFSTLSEMWKRMPQLARDPWQTAVKGQPLTDRNLHVKQNTALLIDQTDLNLLVMSVSSGQSVPPESESFTPGVGLITITADAPVSPVDYTLTGMVAAVCKDGDPSPVLTTQTFAGEDVETPYSIEITGLDTVAYQCGIWIKWTRADGEIFYSAAARGQATPT